MTYSCNMYARFSAGSLLPDFFVGDCNTVVDLFIVVLGRAEHCPHVPVVFS